MHPVEAALYARVSSDQQTRGQTIASQVAALRERIAADGLTLDPEHTFIDDGVSGTSLLRPALERLRDAVALGGVDRLYVQSPDRLARRYAYQVLLVEEFRRAGAEIVFLNRPIGGSPEDDLLLQLQGMIAEYERAKIVERSRRGRRHAAQMGAVSALGRAPFGYRYVPKGEGGGVARVEVVPEQARYMRLMFAWVGLDRLSLREVCRRLQDAGVPTATGQVRWDPTTIARLVRNPAYRGQAMFGRLRSVPPPAKPPLRPRRGQALPRISCSVATPPEQWIAIPVPAIVDPVVFEAAQAQLDENRRRKRGRRRRRWLLQGLTVCGCCGYAYYGKTSRGTSRVPYSYYRCSGSDAQAFGGQAVCHNRPIRVAELERLVWNEVRGVLEDPGRLAEEHERRLAQARTGRGPSHDQVALDRQIGAVRRAIDRLIDSYAEGLIERPEFEPRITGCKQRLGELERRRDALRQEAEATRELFLVIGQLQDFAGRVQASLDDLDWDGRREIIRTLVRRIEIRETEVEVIFRIGVPSRSPGSPGVTTSGQPKDGSCQDCGDRVPRGLLAAALQAEPARSGRDVPDPGLRVHPRGGARLGGQAGAAAGRGPAPAARRQSRPVLARR
jgi:site-specific DNA recombinase